LKLISLGYSNSDIAEKLFIGITTAKTHVSSIHTKLGVKNRNQAVIAGKEKGLI
jgi:ATP/maltotriose-dependent transcriptional regulator MalT